jgi:hypothetical protein
MTICGGARADIVGIYKGLQSPAKFFRGEGDAAWQNFELAACRTAGNGQQLAYAGAGNYSLAHRNKCLSQKSRILLIGPSTNHRFFADLEFRPTPDATRGSSLLPPQADGHEH